MKHSCSKGNFYCEAVFDESPLILQGFLKFKVGENATWTGEIYIEVSNCPFCEYKSKNITHGIALPEPTK